MKAKTKDEKMFVICVKNLKKHLWDVYVGRTRDGGRHCHFSLPFVGIILPLPPADRGYLKQLVVKKNSESTFVYKKPNGRTTRKFKIVMESGEIISIQSIE